MSEPSLDAVRRDQAGWIFLHIEGEPYDRGEQHGQLHATEIQNAIRTARYLAKWDTGEDFDTFTDAAVSQFANKLATISQRGKYAMQVLVGIFRRALVCVTAGFMLEQADDL